MLLREYSDKPVIIREIKLKSISNAQKIKAQNLETRILFGPKTKRLRIKASTPIEPLPEVFWINKQNADKTQTSSRKKKIIVNPVPVQEKIKETILTEPKVKKAIKKNSLINDDKTPEAFARYKYEMPKPVKVSIKDALDELQSHINPPPVDSTVMKKIPFDSNQLNTITSFPLILQSNDIILGSTFAESSIQKNTNIPIPSVSRILQATMPINQRNALIQWKNLKIAELGLEGFEALQKFYLSRGKNFHACVHKYFTGIEVQEKEVPSDVKDVWQSILPVLPEFKAPAPITEQYVTHPYLHYKGIVDCVANHRDILTVIEWKNTDRQKKSIANTFDAPIQLCAYLAALNASEFKNKNQINKGVVVVAYNDGQVANLFELTEQELNVYWKLWLNRLQEYWTRYRDNTLTDEKI